MYRKTSMDVWIGPWILWSSPWSRSFMSQKKKNCWRSAIRGPQDMDLWIGPWIQWSSPWSLPFLSKKIKMACDPRSISHGPWIQWSSPWTRRRKYGWQSAIRDPRSKSHQSLDRAMNSAVQSMVHIFPVSKTLCKPLLLMLTKICSCRETCGKRLFRSLYRNYPLLLLSYINSSC